MRPLSALFLFTVAGSIAACGGGTTEPSKNASTPPKAAADGGTAPSTGVKGGDGGVVGDRPFAGSVAEATALISVAVDKKQSEISSCVRDFRVRRKMARDKVAVSFGIDQEGKLLGVTSKGKEDAELKICVQDALNKVAFPRSHAGVITVTKTYEELVQ